MKSKKPIISVIIPMYNSQLYIEECIKSVQQQTIKELEIIVIDDGSTDDSSIIVENLKKFDKRIELYYQDNSGAGVARNKGINYANGEYLSFLDSDDFFYQKDALEKMIKACISNNVYICGSYRIEYKKNKFYNTDFLKKYILSEKGNLISFKDYQYNFFFQSYIYNTEFIKKNNIFFLEVRKYEDPPFLLNAMDNAEFFYAIPVILHCYRKGHQNYSENKKYIIDNLTGIKEDLLICEKKYNDLFLLEIQRIETMFFNDIRDNKTKELIEILTEINTIYERNTLDGNQSSILVELINKNGKEDNVEVRK